MYDLERVGKQENDPLYVTVMANGKPLKMEIDTGASVSVISEDTYQKTWKGKQAPTLQLAKIRLRSFTGEEVMAKGRIHVEVKHGTAQKKLPLIIMQGRGPNLLGRNWLSQLKLDWKAAYKLHEVDALTKILDKHKAVFEEGLGTIRGVTAKIHVDPEVHPCFYKPRPVPFSMRKKVEDELERLEEDGIIQRKQLSEWAAPIVPVFKGDGSVRICRDYKVTANKAVRVDTHPIPRIEDLFTAMAGGVSFTKLDLSHTYLQLPLDDTSRDYLTINTHKGLFEYTRLPFGVSSAPSIFQRTMESILQGIEHVAIYIDEILVTGRTEEKHLHTLDEVLG